MSDIETVTLDVGELKVEGLNGQNTIIVNRGAATLYVSIYPDIVPDGDNVAAIPAGGAMNLLGTNGTFYLLGTGKVQLTGTDNAWLPISSGGSSGGGGSTGGVSQGYVDSADASTLHSAKAYTDAETAKIQTSLETEIDKVRNEIPAIPDSLPANGGNAETAERIVSYRGSSPDDNQLWVKMGECIIPFTPVDKYTSVVFLFNKIYEDDAADVTATDSTWHINTRLFREDLSYKYNYMNIYSTDPPKNVDPSHFVLAYKDTETERHVELWIKLHRRYQSFSLTVLNNEDTNVPGKWAFHTGIPAESPTEGYEIIQSVIMPTYSDEVLKTEIDEVREAIPTIPESLPANGGHAETADKINTMILEPKSGINWVKIAEGNVLNSAGTLVARIFDSGVLNAHNDIFGVLRIVFGASNGKLLSAKIDWESCSGDINFEDFVLAYYLDNTTNRYHMAVYVNITSTRAFGLMPLYKDITLYNWVFDDVGVEEIPEIYTTRISSSPYSNTYALNELADLKAYIGYTDSDIYGLEADFENNKFTRLAGAVGKTPGADFDSVNAFGGRRRCLVADDGTVVAYQGDSNFDDGVDGLTADGLFVQVMVEQPKFYYKVVPLKTKKIDGTNGYHLRKTRYYISDTPRPGFKVHPAFIQNGIELDKIYLSAFEGCARDMDGKTYIRDDAQVVNFDTDKLSSIINAKPASGTTQALTLANAKKLAQNRGDGWGITTIETLSVTQLLFIIEYATFNSQAAIGNGVVNTTEPIKTGSTLSLGNASGSVASGGVSYRGEENLWGNIGFFIDGVEASNPNPFNANKHGFFIIDNQSISIPSLYTNTSYISCFGYSENYSYLFIPTEHKGTSVFPVGDTVRNDTANHEIFACGGINPMLGLFNFHGIPAWYYGNMINAHLIYIPPVTAMATEEVT